ncbi:MAG: hypothetical protein MJ246_02260 [Clostridia bacterium]|nr:hypothetical protein [Clostridia bacterium]
MATKTYSVFKDALFPIKKILSLPYNYALSDMWQGHVETYEALADLAAHSVIWDLTEIKKIYSIINFHVLYQEEFSTEISYRTGFEEDIEKAPWEHEYKKLSRRQLLLLMLILCNDVVLEEYPSKYVEVDDGKTTIKTDNYSMTMNNPGIGMPGTSFTFKVPGKLEFTLFAYKSDN